MVQPNQKDIVRHVLLNILTVLKVELDGLKDCKRKRKTKITDLINTASLIISNEDLLLDQKPELFIQDISLNEILDISLRIFEKE